MGLSLSFFLIFLGPSAAVVKFTLEFLMTDCRRSSVSPPFDPLSFPIRRFSLQFDCGPNDLPLIDVYVSSLFHGAMVGNGELQRFFCLVFIPFCIAILGGHRLIPTFSPLARERIRGLGVY